LLLLLLLLLLMLLLLLLLLLLLQLPLRRRILPGLRYHWGSGMVVRLPLVNLSLQNCKTCRS
jgi:hypothetical protein